MMFLVVDESKRTNTSWFQTQIAHHAFGTSKREFSWGFLSRCHQRSFEALLQIVDSQVVFAVKADEIMLRTLVIAHEDVLAVHTTIVFPPTFRLLDGFAFGVVVAREWNLMLVEVYDHALLAFGYWLFKCHVFLD